VGDCIPGIRPGSIPVSGYSLFVRNKCQRVDAMFDFCYCQCVDAVKEAFQTIDSMLTAGHRSQLERDFNLCDQISSDRDVYAFVSSLADLFMSAVQYNSETPINVKQLCDNMLVPGTAYQNLVKVHQVTSVQSCAICSAIIVLFLQLF
jgi:Serine carboxypeptidase S28